MPEECLTFSFPQTVLTQEKSSDYDSWVAGRVAEHRGEVREGRVEPVMRTVSPHLWGEAGQLPWGLAQFFC